MRTYHTLYPLSTPSSQKTPDATSGIFFTSENSTTPGLSFYVKTTKHNRASSSCHTGAASVRPYEACACATPPIAISYLPGPPPMSGGLQPSQGEAYGIAAETATRQRRAIALLTKPAALLEPAKPTMSFLGPPSPQPARAQASAAVGRRLPATRRAGSPTCAGHTWTRLSAPHVAPSTAGTEPSTTPRLHGPGTQPSSG